MKSSVISKNTVRKSVDLDSDGDNLVNSLIADLLQGKDFMRRLVAVKVLGELKNPKAVDALVIAAQDDYSGMRRLAVEALGLIGDVRAMEPLINALQDEHHFVRQSAIEALTEIKDEKVIETLIPILQKDKTNVGLVGALAKTNNEEAVKILISTLKDENASARQDAAKALGGRQDTRSIDALLIALQDSYSGTRRHAADSLGLTKDMRVVEPLITALRDFDSDVRKSAATALNSIGWKFENQDVNDQAWYYFACQQWDMCTRLGPHSVEPFNVALRDRDVNLRRKAVIALSTHKSLWMMDLFIFALMDEDVAVRQIAVKALGGIKDDRVIKSLLIALRDNSSIVRGVAAESLELAGWRFENDVPNRIWYLLVSGREKECANIGVAAVQPLVSILCYGDNALSFQAAKGLGFIKDSEKVVLLLDILLNSDIWSVRERVSDVLKNSLSDLTLTLRQQVVSGLDQFQRERDVRFQVSYDDEGC